jgi:GNAT superfamily N-acetyltransferase
MARFDAQQKAIARVEDAGYTLDGAFAEDALPARELFVDASYRGTRVGTAHFSDHGSYAFCQNIEIAEHHQKRGLGSAMYVLAEQLIGKQLQNVWANDTRQSQAAKALWDSASRPFGEIEKV